jgi:hypothetical protein
VICVARNFLDPELHQVFVDELRIQQFITLVPQPCHQINQRDLAGIGRGRKHAFAEKRAADGNAIDAAHQIIAAPRFDAMRKTGFMQLRIKVDDFIVDPCVFARVGAAGHDGTKRMVESDAIRRLPDRAPQPLRHMQAVDGQNAAQGRVVPFDSAGAPAARHREHADGISVQQQFGRYVGITLGQGFSQA